jgi:glutamine synthetase
MTGQAKVGGRAGVAEVEAFLKAHPDIEAAEALVTDPTGVGRGKLLRVADLAKMYHEGRPLLLDPQVSLDITGEDVEETGLVWDIGDADKLAWPVAGSLKRASWMGVPTAQLLLSLWELDGAPYVAAPRHVLARVVRRLEAAGYTPVVAAELEFYVVDPARGADGRLQPPKTPATGRRLDRIDVYSVIELEEFGPFIAELYASARAMGLPAETLISEYAPGQLEVVLRHRADAMRAADEAIQWKRLVRGVAAKHGLLATFMAKPYSGRAGSGFHIHASLADAKGTNLFAPRPAGHAADAPGHCRAARHHRRWHGRLRPQCQFLSPFPIGELCPVARTWGSTIAASPSGAHRRGPRRAIRASRRRRRCQSHLAIATVLAGMLKGSSRS